MDIPEQLNQEYQAGNVCLFIGAGVSVGCGLPDWTELGKRVVKRFPRKPGPGLGSFSAAIAQGKQPPPDPNALLPLKTSILEDENPLLAMRYARSDPYYDLCSLVARSLYDNEIVLSDAVLEIPFLEKVKRICCFNYDDILDRAFSERGKSYLALFQNDRIPLESSQTIVFYPHGYLPAPNRPSYPATDSIVLSEDDYFDLYRSPYAWANMVQLTLLLNYTALFIGCSLMDPNLRRLLDITAAMRPAQKHFAFFQGPPYQKGDAWYKTNYALAYHQVKEHIMEGLGVQPVWLNDYQEIGSILHKLQAESL